MSLQLETVDWKKTILYAIGAVIITAVLIFIFATRLGGRSQGLVLGMVTAVLSLIISLISGSIGLATIIAFAIIVIAGAIGGRVRE